jgi:formate C-acetyltransferase
VDKGVLTRGDAEEMIECLFIKTNEIIGYGWESYHPKRVLCVNSLQYMMLSGIDADGNDTTNEISRIALNAVASLKLKQPTVNIRYHKNIDPAFFERACEVTASGLGYPSYFNDETVITALINNGVARDIAVDYAHYGCNNSILPGHEDELREAWLCIPKCLEYALNHGACMMTGKVQGRITPSAYKMTSMDDLYEALRQQIADAIRKTILHVNLSDRYWNELKPFSFESVLMTDCIEKASSMNDQGSLQKHINVHLVGLATVANSLYAIQKLVFEDQKFSLSELVELLKNNWANDDYTRHYVKNRYAKFGNNEDPVDGVAKKVADIYVREVMKASPTELGRKLYPSIYSLWHHRKFGELCAASADGRLAGETISESQSPVYGTEQQGPTAMFNSIATLPFHMTPTGGLNVKFQSRYFQDEHGYRYLAALLRGYFEKGGMHVQANVIGREVLEDAKKNPEKYRHLLVRVVGYSAYFVSLSPEQQQEIIDRTELSV